MDREAEHDDYADDSQPKQDILDAVAEGGRERREAGDNSGQQNVHPLQHEADGDTRRDEQGAEQAARKQRKDYAADGSANGFQH